MLARALTHITNPPRPWRSLHGAHGRSLWDWRGARFLRDLIAGWQPPVGSLAAARRRECLTWLDYLVEAPAPRWPRELHITIIPRRPGEPRATPHARAA